MTPDILPRTLAVIDRLSERIDSQAMRLGADAPDLVAIIGTFHTLAGNAERRVERYPTLATTLPDLRILRRIQATHELLVRSRGALIRAKQRAVCKALLPPE